LARDRDEYQQIQCSLGEQPFQYADLFGLIKQQWMNASACILHPIGQQADAAQSGEQSGIIVKSTMNRHNSSASFCWHEGETPRNRQENATNA
jgi:hypothetical protein